MTNYSTTDGITKATTSDGLVWNIIPATNGYYVSIIGRTGIHLLPNIISVLRLIG